MSKHVKDGFSLAGSVKNFLDHRKFKKSINGLSKYVRALYLSSKLNVEDLRGHIQKLYAMFSRLNQYAFVNFKNLFHAVNKHKDEIKALKDKMSILEERLRKLEEVKNETN